MRRDLKLVCINIPRCASSTMKCLLNGAIQQDYFALKRREFTVCTVLRHPVDRFVSGAIHIRGAVDAEASPEEAMMVYLDRIERAGDYSDCHLLPQSRYLEGITVDHVLDFATLATDGLQWLRRFLPDLRKMPRENPTKAPLLRAARARAVPSLQGRIARAYDEDMHLYRTHCTVNDSPWSYDP